MRRIREAVESCRKCDLYKTRGEIVFGEGSISAEIMLIGESPGKNEDMQGRPFVGAAGKILDELLGEINLRREDVYIANILKCRPPGNRDPRREEIEACTPYLDEQIAIINPSIICPLGNFATKYITAKYGKNSDGIGTIHGEVFENRSKMKIIPFYHPATATYNPNMREILLNDFKVLEKLISPPGKNRTLSDFTSVEDDRGDEKPIK
jgi:DNA polymerase